MKKISDPEDCKHPCNRQYSWLAMREDGEYCLLEIGCCECGTILGEIDLKMKKRIK